MLVLFSAAQAYQVELVEELNPAGRGTGPGSVTAFLGDSYFQADGGVVGRELMKYDGTNVSLVADIHPAGSSKPRSLTVNDGVLYFTADDGTRGRRLWSFDGASVHLVDTNQFVQTAQELISYDDNLYFRGVRFGHIGIELFHFDGSSIAYTDILPGTGSAYPQHFVEYAGALYFSAAGAPGQGNELWRTDGLTVTKAGQEIRVGSGSAPAWLAVHDGALYFAAFSGHTLSYDMTNLPCFGGRGSVLSCLRVDVCASPEEGRRTAMARAAQQSVSACIMRQTIPNPLPESNPVTSSYPSTQSSHVQTLAPVHRRKLGYVLTCVPEKQGRPFLSLVCAVHTNARCPAAN